MVCEFIIRVKRKRKQISFIRVFFTKYCFLEQYLIGTVLKIERMKEAHNRGKTRSNPRVFSFGFLLSEST